jgi:hypothetical protein
LLVVETPIDLVVVSSTDVNHDVLERAHTNTESEVGTQQQAHEHSRLPKIGRKHRKKNATATCCQLEGERIREALET